MTYYILNLGIQDQAYFAEDVGYHYKNSSDDLYEDDKKGISLKDKKPVISLRKNRGTVNHVIHGLFGFTIVSEVIKDTLQTIAPNDIECFRVKVNMETDLKHYFVNTLRLIDAIDYEQSVYKEFIPNIKVFKAFDKLVLLEDKLAAYHIIRLEKLASEIVISETLKKALSALNIPEIAFTPVNEFTWDLGRVD